MENTNLKIGSLVVRPKDKRQGRVIAIRGMLTDNPSYQVAWEKGHKKWLTKDKFTPRLVA